jgi:hypothetical protein
VVELRLQNVSDLPEMLGEVRGALDAAHLRAVCVGRLLRDAGVPT